MTGEVVIRQNDSGDLFYIVRDGEAVVYETNEKGKKKVNHLFKSDFFGEAALFSNEPRKASVEAITNLKCLTLKRETFIDILGPLQDLMQREKSSHVTESRLALLQAKGAPSQSRVRCPLLSHRAEINQPSVCDIGRSCHSKKEETTQWGARIRCHHDQGTLGRSHATEERGIKAGR